MSHYHPVAGWVKEITSGCLGAYRSLDFVGKSVEVFMYTIEHFAFSLIRG